MNKNGKHKTHEKCEVSGYFNAKSSTNSRVCRCCCCNFFIRDPRRFPCFAECVFFPKKINNPFWGLTVFQRKSDISSGRETKTHIVADENQRKIAKVSFSNNNYSCRIIYHSTTTTNRNNATTQHHQHTTVHTTHREDAEIWRHGQRDKERRRHSQW